MTNREMRALELNSEYFGVSRRLLMENAGQAVAQEIASLFKPDESVTVFCGLGGNGGDGFVTARYLNSMGYSVKVFLAGKADQISDESALKNFQVLRSIGSVPICEIYDSSLIPALETQIVVDALLGIGTKGVLKPPISQLVVAINSINAHRVAVDVPTGVDSDTGEVFGEAVKADLTVTFHRSKKGFVKAKRYVGKLVVRSIGLPAEFERFAGPGDVSLVTKSRSPESHKGDYGRLLVIGGSETFSGAPTLVALAALRTGVDLAYVAAPEKTAYAISSISPDLITVKLKGENLSPGDVSVLKPYVEVCDAVAMGPGLGLHPETKKAVRMLVDMTESLRKPLLLDADGLKAFSEFKRKMTIPSVLTPHMGEYAILTGKKPPEKIEEKAKHVQRTAVNLGATVLLKGSIDVVADSRRVKLNFSGNSGMTVGGTGDVLSGVVGAFLAQRVDPFEAAVAGAFVNGAAGDFVSVEKGHHMVASDLIGWLPHVLMDPMSHLQVRRPGDRTS